MRSKRGRVFIDDGFVVNRKRSITDAVHQFITGYNVENAQRLNPHGLRNFQKVLPQLQ